MIDSFTGAYRFLSNFYVCPFEWDGKMWPTAEHAYQAAKCADPAEADQVRKQSKAGQAKRLGKRVKIREDWEEIKLDVMEEIVHAKFSQGRLRELLLKTGDRELREGNDWGDTFWGTVDGHGENHLGKILMAVRDNLPEDAT